MASKKIQIFGVFFRRHLFLLNCNFVKTNAWLVVNNFSASMVAMSLAEKQILAAGTVPNPHTSSVNNTMTKTAKHRRWRQPVAAHLDLMKEHLYRFVASKGSNHHFSRFSPERMEETINLIKHIEKFNSGYKEWIRANVPNPEKFLREA